MKKTMIECFEEVSDPRDINDVSHKLIDIIVVTVLAVLCGANTWNDIEDFGESKKVWLMKFLELPSGIPSHDTFNRVFSRINPKEFHECFVEWISTLYEKISREIISIDGKTVRRSKSKQKSAIHVVSAWANKNKLVLGQIKVDEKSNEITAIPELLKALDINGCIVTIDAMGTQVDIVEEIIKAGAEYVLALKENQKTLHDDVKLYMEEEILPQGKQVLQDKGIYCKTVEKDHGRIEKREYYFVPEVQWLDQLERWPKLYAIGMVCSERQENDKTTFDTRLFIMSHISCVSEFAFAVRGHWGVENELHWCLDIGFREDDSRARIDNAAENLNVIRHMALNMLKKERTLKRGIQGKRLKCAWDNEYLCKVISGGFEIFEGL